MYGKAMYEKDLQAIEVASGCISAAIAGSDYAYRTEPFIDDFLTISEYWWSRCPITRKKLLAPGPDVQEIASVFLHLVQGKELGGFKAQKFEAILERCRRKCKGKLLGTRLMMLDKDSHKTANCADKNTHDEGCHCKGLTLFNLAQGQVNANG